MKIGLFFGSFNPIHIGHMAIAQYMTQHTDLDKIWMVVSPQNPMKEKKSLLDQHHRLSMVRIACEEDQTIEGSNIEFSLPMPSYTSDTLVYLEEKYPDNEFALIIGGDNLDSFHKWKNYEHIIENYSIYVYPRPNTKGSILEGHKNLQLTKAPLMDISSEFIRKCIKEKRKVNYFLPEKIWSYIDEMNFYK
jgi:nicotinate-nucleotide adenylyltransferase